MSRVHTWSDDPFVTTDEVAGKLYGEIHPALSRLRTEAWPALQARTSELQREVSGGIQELSRLRDDTFSSPEARITEWDSTLQATRTKVESLRETQKDLVHILKAELITKARPTVDPAQEAFVRQDLASMLDSSRNPLQDLLNIARGAHRGRAAVVAGDFGDAYVQKLIPDQRTREGIRTALDAAVIEGSIAHGDQDQKAAARAAKEVLPRVSSWLSASTVPAMARLKEAGSARPR